MGGDEFAILLEAAGNSEDVKSIVGRIQANLALPCELQGNTVIVGASIGVVMSIATCKQMDDLLRNADRAMYQAKAGGGNQYKIFEVEARE